MQQAVNDGLRPIEGKTTGHMKVSQLLIASRPHGIMVMACSWPSIEEIAELTEDRKNPDKRLGAVTAQLREMEMGDHAQ